VQVTVNAETIFHVGFHPDISRYDLDFLILRLDCGVPLHDPYDTGKKGYYNVTGSFWKGLGLHFAVGYPF